MDLGTTVILCILGAGAIVGLVAISRRLWWDRPTGRHGRERTPAEWSNTLKYYICVTIGIGTHCEYCNKPFFFGKNKAKCHAERRAADREAKKHSAGGTGRGSHSYYVGKYGNITKW